MEKAPPSAERAIEGLNTVCLHSFWSWHEEHRAASSRGRDCPRRAHMPGLKRSSPGNLVKCTEHMLTLREANAVMSPQKLSFGNLRKQQQAEVETIGLGYCLVILPKSKLPGFGAVMLASCKPMHYFFGGFKLHLCDGSTHMDRF